MIKEAAQFSISHILGTDTTNKELLYKIPPYQREYTWGKENWDNLYNDLVEADKGYFLGSVICIEDEYAILGNTKLLQVIDGQQRLTTLSIVVTALYSSIHNLISQDQGKLFQDKKMNKKWLDMQSMLRVDDQFGDVTENRLTLSIQQNNQDDYKYLLDSIFNTDSVIKPKYYESRSICRGYRFFLNKFEELDDQGQRIYNLYSLFEFFEKICSAIIVRIAVDNMGSAFVLFESINNRGVPLTPIDLIKNMIISDLVKTSKDADTINERWQTIVKNVEGYEDQVRFLRHFYHAYKVNPAIGLAKYPKATKSNIIHIYTTLIRNNSQYILDQLVKKSSYYAALISPEKLENSDDMFVYKDFLINLKRVKSVPANSFILYLMTSFPDSKIGEILDYLESWFIRRHITNYPGTNKLDDIFLSLIEIVGDSKLLEIDVIIQYLNKLISKSDKDDFVNSLMILPIYDDNTDATRSLLIKLEKMDRTKEENVDFWQTSSKKLVWSVEHVLPQNIDNGSLWWQKYNEEDHANLKHTLGNLTLTCYNSNLSNSEFNIKCDAKDKEGKSIGLKSGSIKLNQDFIELNNWEKIHIRKRGKRLAQKFAALFE